MKPCPFPFFANAEVHTFELHLSTVFPDFIKRFSKKVKAAGGKYNDVRGYYRVSHRYVDLPLSAWELADQLIKENTKLEVEQRVFGPNGQRKPPPRFGEPYQGTTVILRGGMYQRTPTIVHHVASLAELADLFQRAVAFDIHEGFADEPEVIREERRKAEAERIAARAQEARYERAEEYRPSDRIDAEVRAVIWKNVEVQKP